jgi:hypothetical protein
MTREHLQKHTLNLRPGDYDYLTDVFGPHSIPVSVVIRKIISKYVDQLKRKEGPLNLDLGDME